MNGAMVYAAISRETFWREASRWQAAAGLDETLPLLWTLADKARSHATLGLFLRMAEWVRA